MFNIAFLSSEVAPYSKSGGLADVASALPKELKRKGYGVKVITPLYSAVNYDKYRLKRIMENCVVHMGNCQEFYSVHHSDHDGVDVYFIEFGKYFDRPGYYSNLADEYQDNAYRFSFFCRAAMQLCKDLNYWPSIVHTSDWQTSFAAYAVKKSWDPFWNGVKTVLTIHNIGYQGIYSPDVLPYAGVDMADFTADGFEVYGNVNLLKMGINFADKINTVSPHYAKEILTPQYGEGLEYYLNRRAWDLLGIVNALDTNVWNPETDGLIEKNYTSKTYKTGKAACKKAFQKLFNLEERPDVPLCAFVARFVNQKGINILAEVVRAMVDDFDLQVTILGNGEDWANNFFGDLPKYYPGRIGAYIGFSYPPVNQFVSASDFFWVPSLYEPCGLTQQQAQAYGSLPIVRATGGLIDTVENYNPSTGEGTGFMFDEFSGHALYHTTAWAVDTYRNRPDDMDKMIGQAMDKDLSWSNSADQYIQMYNWAMWG